MHCKETESNESTARSGRVGKKAKALAGLTALVAASATPASPIPTPEAAAAGWGANFYNGDVCAYWHGVLGSACLYANSGSSMMTYGTLSLSFDARMPYDRQVRAGSGNGSTNRCATNQGPLPQNNYGISHYDNYSGVIQGRVWFHNSSWCKPWEPGGGGVLRTELFTHSEETASQTQSSTDERYRWDGASDYYSAGCIKVSTGKNGNLGTIDNDWHTRNYPYTKQMAVDA